MDKKDFLNKLLEKAEFVDLKKIDWGSIDMALGTSFKTDGTRYTHRCVNCGNPVYFHDKMPEDTAFIDEKCFVKIHEKEKKT